MERLLISRRRALGLAGVAAAGLAAAPFSGPAVHASPPTDSPRIDRKAKNVIFLVSDGMSSGTLILADLYSRTQLGRESAWSVLMRRPGFRRALQTTHSADGWVTDSAAASSAWGIGVKVENGSIGIGTDRLARVPILVHAAQNGKKTGLVTTTRVTHATPAGFSANVPRRDMERDIAIDQITRKIDVILGGGSRFFSPKVLERGKDTVIVRTAEELAKHEHAAGKPTLGLFASSHLPFVVDRESSVPGLAAMSAKALDALSKSAEGFVLQIEGGRVDHAAHSSDAWGLVREQIEFDETLAAVAAWVQTRDDTLLIITSDHGNANPGLTLYGKRGKDAFAKLARAKNTFEWIDGKLPPAERMADRLAAIPGLVEQATGVALGAEAVKRLAASIRGEPTEAFAANNVWSFVLGQLLANEWGVSFISPNHTSDPVELLAFGPGAEAIPTWVDNTQLHTVMVAALGLAPATPLPGFDKPVPALKPLSDD